ncbi:hypothetical protein ES731_13890 [Psychroflexus gondwanensis]|jgi:hypothetical protein|uniref:hypothetical protein n=1 Tax=Psychroflexus gondwanensis TaxID=251 RepID=UPI0011BF7EFD|nr:hypothetical protein [Psychroflexus gondwanensis]TXE16498.1 hypothetical protein ES731_13890 [Psychroflexus gondwanensis]
MEKKEGRKLDMRFSSIKVNKFSQFDLSKEFDLSNKPFVNFISNFGFKITPGENKISCFINVEMKIIETNEAFAELKVENIFEIKPMSLISKPNNKGGYDIPNDILRTIVTISISTVRGILSEKLKGTVIQNEIYPLINPSSIFEQIENKKNQN